MNNETATESQALLVQTELTVVTTAIEVALGVRELTTEFSERRKTLIEAGNAYKAPPTDDETQEKMLAAQRALASLRIEVTKQADALKSPLNSARTKIIDLHKSGIATIEKEESRLAGLINHRQQLLALEREEREAKAEQERQRIAKEAADAQRAAEEADRKRLAAEKAASDAELLKGKRKEQAESEAKRLADEARAAEEEAFEKGMAIENAPTPIAALVSDLPMAKEVFDFEIERGPTSTQKHSALMLLCAHPELFTFKINEDDRGCSFTLRVADLTDRLNGKLQPAITGAPGIRVTKKLTKLR